MSINDTIARTIKLHPDCFRGLAALPQTAGVRPKAAAEKLPRCVEEYGFIGCKINPDPGEGAAETPNIGDDYWFPLYEKMVELDVPGEIGGECVRDSDIVPRLGALTIRL